MQFDAIIIGGSFAGLSAAIHIARGCRRVCVIDGGRPRNRFSSASHGFFGQDGSEPFAMIASARAQLKTYPTVKMLAAEAKDARVIDGGVAITVGSGEVLTAAKLILAFGVSDILPDLRGLKERWGASVLHCPYCHCYEYSGKRLGVLYTNPMSTHQALLIPDWGPTTLFLNGNEMPSTDTLAKLAIRGVTIEPEPVSELRGEGGNLSSVMLRDGRTVSIEALYMAPRTRLNSSIAEVLGCEIEDGPFGPIIKTDMFKKTNIPGVYAAGDVARVPHNVSFAVADGVMAGMSVHQSLIFGPLDS